MNNQSQNILLDIQLHNGVITYNDFTIDPAMPFSTQKWSYKQDLVQISFYNDLYIIDVGWYPEFDEKGHFLIRTIKSYAWDSPLLQLHCTDIHTLRKYLQLAINTVTQL